MDTDAKSYYNIIAAELMVKYHEYTAAYKAIYTKLTTRNDLSMAIQSTSKRKVKRWL